MIIGSPKSGYSLPSYRSSSMARSTSTSHPSAPPQVALQFGVGEGKMFVGMLAMSIIMPSLLLARMAAFAAIRPGVIVRDVFQARKMSNALADMDQDSQIFALLEKAIRNDRAPYRYTELAWGPLRWGAANIRHLKDDNLKTELILRAMESTTQYFRPGKVRKDLDKAIETVQNAALQQELKTLSSNLKLAFPGGLKRNYPAQTAYETGLKKLMNQAAPPKT